MLNFLQIILAMQTTDIHYIARTIKGRTIRKVMGGGGEKPKKKFMQGKIPRKKIRAKKKVKRCRGFHPQKKFLPKQRAKKKIRAS